MSAPYLSVTISLNSPRSSESMVAVGRTCDKQSTAQNCPGICLPSQKKTTLPLICQVMLPFQVRVSQLWDVMQFSLCRLLLWGEKSRLIKNMNTQIDPKESQRAHREVLQGIGRRRCDGTLLTVQMREGPSVTGSPGSARGRTSGQKTKSLNRTQQMRDPSP